MVKVLVVDDHALIRRVIRDVLWQESDLEIVAEACNGYEAEIQAAKVQPDVVLMDLDMPGRGGLDATERVLACSPRSRVIILTASRSEHHAVSAIQHGAVGYLTKDVEPETLIHAIRCAIRDELYLTRPIAARLLAHLRSLQPPSDMDPMQRRLTLASKKMGTAFKESVETPAPLVAVQPAGGAGAMRTVRAEVETQQPAWGTNTGGQALRGRDQNTLRPSDRQAFPPPSERERGFLDRLWKGRRQDPHRDLASRVSTQHQTVVPISTASANELAQVSRSPGEPEALSLRRGSAGEGEVHGTLPRPERSAGNPAWGAGNKPGHPEARSVHGHAGHEVIAPTAPRAVSNLAPDMPGACQQAQQWQASLPPASSSNPAVRGREAIAQTVRGMISNASDASDARSGITRGASINPTFEDEPTGEKAVVHKHIPQTTGSFRVKLVAVH